MTTFGTGNFGSGTFGEPRLTLDTLDLVTVTDTGVLLRVFFEAAGSSDAALRSVARAAAYLDTSTASDAAALTSSRTLTDPAGAADTRRATVILAGHDDAGPADTVSRAARIVRAVMDAAGPSDTHRVFVVRPIAENAGPADSVARTANATLRVTDISTSTDSVQIGVSAAGSLIRIEPGGTTDAAALSRRRGTQTDRAGTTDRLVAALLHRLSATDTTGTADSVSIVLTGVSRSAEFEDPSLVTDTARLERPRVFVDAATGRDQLVLALHRPRSYVEAATAGDLNVSIVVHAHGPVARPRAAAVERPRR